MEKNYKEMWEGLKKYYGFILENAEDSETIITFSLLKMMMRAVEDIGLSVLDVKTIDKILSKMDGKKEDK